MNIYIDLGGAKGKGVKKKKEFEAVCQSIGLKPVPFKRFVSTRFRIIRLCLQPVLESWEGIQRYYNSLKKSTERQNLLKAYLVDREWMAFLKIKFVYGGIRELIEGIDYFEKRDSVAHEIRSKMESLLRSQILKFHNETAVNEVENDMISICKKKIVAELLPVNVDDKETLLSKRKVFVGQEVSGLIKSLSLDPKSAQLKLFYGSVYTFHKVVITLLDQVFPNWLKNTELDYMECFSQKYAPKISTSFQMKYLANRFSKIVTNIEPIEGLDQIISEIETYSTDDEVG